MVEKSWRVGVDMRVLSKNTGRVRRVEEEPNFMLNVSSRRRGLRLLGLGWEVFTEGWGWGWSCRKLEAGGAMGDLNT